MKIADLKVSSFSKHNFFGDKLLKNTSKSQNVLIKDGVLIKPTDTRCKKIANALTLGETVKKLYSFGNELYCFTSGRKLLKLDGQTFSIVAEFDSDTLPYAVNLLKNGENRLLFTTDTNSLIVREDGEIERLSTPLGNHAVLFGGMLFSSNDNVIKFSTLFSHNDFSSGIDNGGFLTTDTAYGGIVALVARKDKLLVMCKHAIYELIPYGERTDYKLKKYDLTPISIIEGTIGDTCDGVTFINGNRLTIFKNGEIYEVKGTYELSNYTVSGNCAVDSKYYYLPIADSNGENLLFRYDVNDGTQSFVHLDFPIVERGGYIVRNEGVYQLGTDGEYSCQASWESLPTDFSSGNKKAILGFSAYSEAEAVLSISGDFGSKEFLLKSGYNEKQTNLTSNEFVFLVKSDSEKFKIRNVSIVYRIKEG